MILAPIEIESTMSAKSAISQAMKSSERTTSEMKAPTPEVTSNPAVGPANSMLMRSRRQSRARVVGCASSREGESRDACECDDGVVTAPVEAATVGVVDEASPIGESRWPPALALVAFLALNVALRVWLPSESAVRLPWLVPAIEGVLLVLLLVGQPGRLGERSPWLRRLALTFVVALVVAALWATVNLVRDLIDGTGVTQSPTKLLANGALVWLGNNLAFALLYWLMDSGGPIARVRQSVPVDFAFTQHKSPELAPAGWRPVFLDYLHLGFTNATAFSPTDVMPLTHRAKYTMLVQSTVALALFGLIVARAVNAFT